MNLQTEKLSNRLIGPKRSMSVFFTWLIPVVWVILALLTVLFPGGENIGLLSGVLPGVLFFGKGVGLPKLLLASAVLMMIAGAMADWRRVLLSKWLRSCALAAVLVFCLLILSFANEVMRTSLAGASNRFDLDDVTRVLSSLLVCLNGGLYLGTAFALILTFRNAERQQSKE